MMAVPKHSNPFRIHGVVSDQFFTDRADEVAQVQQTFREPASKLLVYGPRRMGKTSAILRAIESHTKTGGVALLADLSTTSSVVDVSNRILAGVGQLLGKTWKDSLHNFVQRLGMSVSLTPDPASGLILPSLGFSLRSAPLEEQRNSLSRTLDSLNTLAEERKTNIGIALDEFQQLRQFGGDDAEWHLRGTIQHHQHLSYVLAGSQAHIIEQMLEKGRAFYGLMDQLKFGPIDPAHLATWIDDRMTNAGVAATGVGVVAVDRAGPRTRDIVQVARRCFDTCKMRGNADPEDVTSAFDDVVTEQESVLEGSWRALTPLQQNVLRAVASDAKGLTTKGSITRFGLSSSGTASNAASALITGGYLVKGESNTGYLFENPFLGRWVLRETMLDLGAGK